MKYDVGARNLGGGKIESYVDYEPGGISTHAVDVIIRQAG